MYIYFGPWKKDKRYSYSMDEDAVCYFRPFLRKTYTFTDKDGNVCFLGEPEIFHNHHTGLYFYGNDVDNITSNTSFEELKIKFDETILKIGYGIKDINIVFLTQDKFDKLMLLV